MPELSSVQEFPSSDRPATETEPDTCKDPFEHLHHLCRAHRFDEALEELKTPANITFFEQEVDRVERELLPVELQNADWLDQQQREMLTILELFDTPTFEHSLNVYRIAHEKIERDPDVREYLTKNLATENISLEELYAACLLHDIGKTKISPEVLHNTLTDENWLDLLVKNRGNITLPDTDLDLDQLIAMPAEDRRTYFDVHPEHRPLRLVPIKYGLEPQALQTLVDHGIDPEQSLGIIIEEHERESRRILEKYGYSTIADLAGKHHNYQERILTKEAQPVAVTAMRMSYALSALQIVDVTEARTSKKRSYRKADSTLTAYAALISEASYHPDPHLTALWVKKEFQEAMGRFDSLDDRDKEAVNILHSFLQEQGLAAESPLQENLPTRREAA